jgi:NitT/TauT family transport system substrate-binding protein
MSRINAILLALGLTVAAAPPVRAEAVLVTLYKGDPTGAPFAIALEKGFFKKAGIDVTEVISGPGGGASVRAAMANPLGFGEVSPAGAIAAINQGQDIKIVGIGSRLLDVYLVTMPNSSIKTVKDMDGKTFAISNPKSLTELTAVMVAKKFGLNPNSIKRVALGSQGGALTALEKGAVDATGISVINYLTRNGAQKYRTLLAPKEMPDLPPGIEIATGTLMREHPEKLQALLAGRREGVKYLYEHIDDSIKILSKLYAPLLPDKVASMVYELAATKFWSEGNIEMNLLDTAMDAMLSVDMLKSKVDLSKMVDSSFLPADLQKRQK